LKKVVAQFKLSERGGQTMTLSRRTLWIGVALAVAAIVVLIAVFTGGGGGGGIDY
jgi:hypothetical protein